MPIELQNAHATPLPSAAGTGMRRARNPEEAAKQFEQVLARQFVQSMTKDLFKSGLDGEEGFGWTDSYGDAQRDVMTDVLTQSLLDKGTFRLSELLLRQWSRTGMNPDAASETLSTPADPSL